MKSAEKPIIITLDLHGCKYAEQVHQVIREAFDFPDCTEETGVRSGICLMNRENVR